MKYITFLTEQVKEDAKNHGYLENIEKLANKIESEQTDIIFQPYGHSNYRRKAFGKNFRLVAYEKIIDNFSIYCFLKFYVRSDKEYEKFITNNDIVHKYLPRDTELIDYAKNRNDIIHYYKPEVSEQENNFLYDYQYDVFSNNIIILESIDWVNAISSKEFEDYRSRIYDILIKFFNNPDNYINNYLITSEMDSCIKIYYKYFEDLKSIFLIAPFINKDDEKEQYINTEYSNILSNSNITREYLLKKSIKAYPELIVYELNTWLTIQKDNEANLALSPEEEVILNNINSPSESKKFPLFINGRAGSGKSTILIYLFSDIIQKFLKFTNTGEIEKTGYPLFITYSSTLLENVKKLTKKLFEFNYKKISEVSNNYREIEINLFVDICFRKFQDIILELLGFESKLKYKQENFIDYTKFKKMFIQFVKQNPDNDIRSLSPEICWHIIRTFIKGMKNEDNIELGLNEYEELPKSFRTITSQTYKIVFERIWEGWYKKECEDRKLWDSQDITRELLNKPDSNISKFTAIFCDEAQDFTRIELELIFKLNLFSNREVDSKYLKFIPFAFAGDPFQTLNPTGFNWDSISANFHEKIVKPMDKFSLNQLEFNYNELTNNYRSSKGIVLFSNLIQLLRGVLFNIKDLKPQQCWKAEDDIIPEIYKLSDEKTFSILKEESEKGIVFIMPAIEGGDEEYINRDNLLNEISKLRKDFKGNLLTPMLSKGLEFSKVVVYKFGQEYVDRNNIEKNGFNFLDKIGKGGIISEEFLPFQYFINNLYVACSRAKKRLFIVDTEDGINNFWLKLNELKDELVLKYQEMTGKNEWNENVVCDILKGQDIENIKKDPDQPQDLAEKFYNIGLSMRDSYQLKLARQNFILAKKYDEAKLCDALIFEFEDEYNKAALKYLELEKKNEAIRCFWEAENYEKIIEFCHENDTRYIAGKYMLNKIDSLGFLNAICELIQSEEVMKNFEEKYYNDTKWNELISRAIGEISSSDTLNLNSLKIADSKIQLLSRIDENIKNSNEFALLLYKANEFERACETWEIQKNTGHNKYLNAKLNITEFPEKIEWLYRLKKSKEILDYFNNNHVSITDYQNTLIDYILNVLIIENYELLVSELTKLNQDKKYRINIDTLLKIYSKLLEKNNYKLYYDIYYSKTERDDILKTFDSIRENKISNLEQLIFFLSQLNVSIENNYLLNALSTTSFHIFDNENYNFNARIEIYKILINSILRQNLDPNEVDLKQLQLKIVDFIKYLINDMKIVKEIGVDALGASLERSGYLIPTLEFYEDIFRKNSKNYKTSEIEFAKERWVKTKERQGLSNESKSQIDEANQNFNKFLLIRKYNDISVITAYPDVPDLNVNYDIIFSEKKESEQLAEISENNSSSDNEENKLNIENLHTFTMKKAESNSSEIFLSKFDIVIKNDNLRITNKENFDRIFFDLRKKYFIYSQSDIKPKKSFEQNKKVWEIKEWNMWLIVLNETPSKLFIAYMDINNIVKECLL